MFCRLLAAALFPALAFGQEATDFRSRSVYAGMTVMHPDADPQLANQEGHAALIAGMTWRRSRHIGIDLAFFDTGQQANMPRVERSGLAPRGERDDAHINAMGVALGLNLFYPLGKLEPYVGAGLGYYRSEISNVGSIFHVVLPPDFAKRHDDRVGVHYLVGADVALSERTKLCVEYRRLALDANFGPEFGGKTKVGGGMVVVALRAVVR